MNRNKEKKYIEKYCSGCGLCHSEYGTKLIYDSKGFPYANVDDENLEIFCKICPVYYYHAKAKHGVWGNVKQALVGYSSDNDIRYKAATGGALTALCIQLIESKKVDAVIHTTFDPLDPTKTVSCVSTTKEEIISRCGSRYSISSPLMNLSKLIKPGKKYAFVGKPCDVMSLRRYMENNTGLKESILYLLSFFCAGEPSNIIQYELIQALGVSPNEVSSIRYRGNGWPGYYTVTTKDNTVKTMEYCKSWGLYLGRDIRYLCRYCLDGTGDAADIVCADFWMLDNSCKPDFSEHEGKNIIICRTDIGLNLLNEAIRDNHLTIIDDFTSKMDSHFHFYQPAQYKRKGTMGSVIAAMKATHKLAPQYSKSYLKLYGKETDFKTKYRFFLGTLKRIIKGKI